MFANFPAHCVFTVKNSIFLHVALLDDESILKYF